jgi:AAA family ATP:ADP antiporter
MSVTHFWFAVNDLFNLHQAKRIVSFFVTGGLLGGIAGSILTTQLVPTIGPVNLLLVCPIIFLLNLGLIGFLYSNYGKSEKAVGASAAKPGYFSSLRMIRDDRYLRVLAGLFASAVIMASLINYQFKIVLKEAIPNDGARTSFLGKFFLIILLLAAVFHLLTTGHILRRFGIRSSLLMEPTVLLLACIAVFFIPVSALILWACVIRGCEKTFDCTISQSVRELLYMPIPASIKYQAKTYIDMFINKLSVGLGAILFWVLYRAFSFAGKSSAAQVQEIGVFVIGFAAISIILIWNIYTGYIGAVKNGLSRKWQDVHRILADHVDLDAARLAVDALQSRERSSTLYAMSLFQMIRKERLSPEMISILSYREDELKAE